MAIGSSLGITLPTQGGNTGTWGTDLNTELQKVIDAVEAQVPASAIDFSADFDLNDFAIVDVAHASFVGQASVLELNSLYFDTSGELYVRDGANNAFAITSGGALSGAGGSITGVGYGSSGIEINWDATRYNVKNGSGADDYADIRFNSAILRDGSSHDITIDCPSIGASYTITLPTAVPGGTSLVTMDAAGALATTLTPSVTTLTATGLITAQAGVTASANQDLTISGTGELKHGSRVLQMGGSDWVGESSHSYNTAGECVNGTNSQSNFLRIPLDSGARITNLQCYARQSAAGTLTFAFYTVDDTGAKSVAIGTDTSTSTPGVVSMTIASLTTTMATGSSYLLEVSCSGAGVVQTGNVEVTYDRP